MAAWFSAHRRIHERAKLGLYPLPSNESARYASLSSATFGARIAAISVRNSRIDTPESHAGAISPWRIALLIRRARIDSAASTPAVCVALRRLLVITCSSARRRVQKFFFMLPEVVADGLAE